MFDNNEDDLQFDENQLKILEDLKSANEDTPASRTNKTIENNSSHNISKVLLEQLLDIDKSSQKSDQIEKIQQNKENARYLPNYDGDEPDVVRKSENPNKKRNKNEKRLLEIIKNNKSKGNDDLDKIEEQMFAIELNEEKDFEKPLSPLNAKVNK